MQSAVVSRGDEGVAGRHPLFITPVHDHNVPKAQMIRRHRGIQTLGSRWSTTVKNQPAPTVHRQALRIE
jgi:hypothetical protein